MFQIDGNFGAASGIASMLLRSCYGMIELLPALPDAWKSGRMEGLLAEGGVEVSIEWKDHQLVLAVLKSCVSQEIEVRCCGQKWKIHLQENEEKVIEFVSKKLANGKRIQELRMLKEDACICKRKFKNLVCLRVFLKI